MRNNCVVIGGGIGGLTAGALLKKWGMNVTLVDASSKLGGLAGSISKDGYSFDIGASSLWGFNSGEVFCWLFRELQLDGILEEESGLITRLKPSLQLVLPQNRLNFYSDNSLFIEELKREFPKQASAITRVLQELKTIEEEIFSKKSELHPYSMVDRYTSTSQSFKFQSSSLHRVFQKKRTLFSLLEKEGISEMEPLFNLFLFFFGKKTAADIPLELASIIYGISQRGMIQIQGGTHILVNMLEDQIKDRGGKILNNSVAEEIVMKNGRVSSVKVRQADEIIEIDAKYVIADISFLHLQQDMIKDKKRFFKFSNLKFSEPENRIVPFTLFLGVDQKVIPEPMKERVLFMKSGNKALVDTQETAAPCENFYSIFVDSENSTKSAPEGKRSIVATSWYSEKESSNINWKTEKEKKIKESIEDLEQVIPFLSDYLDLTFAMTPEDYNKAVGRNGELIDRKHFFYHSPSFNVKTPIKGLFMAGEGTYPIAGVAHAAKSGIKAAECVKKMAEKVFRK